MTPHRSRSARSLLLQFGTLIGWSLCCVAVTRSEALPAPPPTAAVVPYYDNLDETLKQAGEQLVTKLRERNYQNVGVLKFLVATGSAKPSDRVGELNQSLANRLLVAMILANPDDKLGLLVDPAQALAASGNTKANHTTPEGRRAFFIKDQKYPLAWGKAQVSADAFVTGVARLAKDLRSLTLRLSVFDKTGQVIDPFIPEMTVAVNPRILAEAGVSYLLTPKHAPELFQATGSRGLPKHLVGQKIVDSSPATEGLLGYASTATDPLPPRNLPKNLEVVADFKPETKSASTLPDDKGTDNPPIQLRILYDGKPVRSVHRKVKEPKEGTKVAFEVMNVSNQVYGVVLKVNGENTLFREKFDYSDCHKWILQPGEKVLIEGFQEDFVKMTPFEVKSPAESIDEEIHYGPNVGLFQLAAFPGRMVDPTSIVANQSKKEESESVASRPAQMLASISRGSLLSQRDSVPGTLDALKADLLGREQQDSARSTSRGLIGRAKTQGEREVVKVKFQADTTVPTMLLTIRYYEPKTD